MESLRIETSMAEIARQIAGGKLTIALIAKINGISEETVRGVAFNTNEYKEELDWTQEELNKFNRSR